MPNFCTIVEKRWAILIDDLLRLAHRALDRIVRRTKHVGADKVAHEDFPADGLLDSACKAILAAFLLGFGVYRAVPIELRLGRGACRGVSRFAA